MTDQQKTTAEELAEETAEEQLPEEELIEETAEAEPKEQPAGILGRHAEDAAVPADAVG